MFHFYAQLSKEFDPFSSMVKIAILRINKNKPFAIFDHLWSLKSEPCCLSARFTIKFLSLKKYRYLFYICFYLIYYFHHVPQFVQN